MSIRIVLNHSAIAQLTAKLNRALEQTADELIGDVRDSATIPRETGQLQGEAMSSQKLGEGLVAITNDTPYARRLYYHPEYNFSTTENANAGGLWWDAYIDGPKKNVAIKKFKLMCKKVGL